MAVVRAWTRLYSCGVPRAVRAARREEIESDLWESEHDPDTGGHVRLAMCVLARMLAGIPDDVAWRLEHVTMNESARFRVALTGAAAGAVAAWFAIGSIASQLPAPPGPPQFVAPAPPPPPPPPPPPDPRAAGGARNADVEVTYGETSYTIAGNVRRPRKITDARPVYPPIALTADVSGDVVIEATIDERGRVADARIVQSVPIFDQAAIDAVKQWRFEPTAVDGAFARVVITVTVTFTSPR
jgi:TonB family protein